MPERVDRENAGAPRGGWKAAVMLAVWLAASYAAGGVGALFGPGAGEGGWYDTLRRPALTPPGWVFPVVWNVLYLLMGLAAWLVWRRRADGRTAALTLFVVQLVLNAAWSVLFFGLHSPGAALIEIVALWLAIAATVVAFLRVSRPAGVLMLPYLAWVSFAIYLNAAIWALNR